MNFSLYPIFGLADQIDLEPFDRAVLPFEVMENIRIEAVAERFRPGTFDLGATRFGADIKGYLETVRFAIVHRYDSEVPLAVDRKHINDQTQRDDSEDMMRQLMACLRLIRPMRARALLMRGTVRSEDGTFDVTGYDVPPLHLIEVPEVQKLFKLRNRDCEDLRRYAPKVLQAMRGEFWKFRMALHFHELGYFQCLDWKARYLLWASSIESIYTTHNPNHRGSKVATERIKWLLDEDTSIYAPGDLNQFDEDPHLTVGKTVKDLYNVRNFLAHGDRIPDLYFQHDGRIGLNGGVQRREVILEAASFIIRTSLLKILRDGLLVHFADAASTEAFFDSNNLTNSKINAQRPTKSV